MKLEELLGAELYAQVKAKLDEVNGNEPDKLKHVRYADLSEGEYIGKGKHEALQAKYDSQAQELVSANQLIAELQKGTKGNEALQTKITEYESQVAQLQEALEKTQIENAIQLALRDAKAVDPDYLTFKLREKYSADELKLGEDGKIKGMDDKLAGLKTQFPTQFESNSKKNILENKLPDEGDKGDVITKEAFAKMGYQDRVKLFNENPEAYAELTKN
jgi:hypothetical protein